MRARVYLKSGQTVEFDTEHLETTKNKMDNSYTELRWKTPTEALPGEDTILSLHTVDLDQIAAVVVEKSPQDEPEEPGEGEGNP